MTVWGFSEAKTPESPLRFGGEPWFPEARQAFPTLFFISPRPISLVTRLSSMTQRGAFMVRAKGTGGSQG